MILVLDRTAKSVKKGRSYYYSKTYPLGFPRVNIEGSVGSSKNDFVLCSVAFRYLEVKDAWKTFIKLSTAL